MYANSACFASGMFQSTPPHGGRHCSAHDCLSLYRFNPRPRTGGDHPYLFLSPCVSSFNPRPRTGGDSHLYNPLSDHFIVSIHAPARGATNHPAAHANLVGRFQSTPPHGGRLCSYNSLNLKSLFSPFRELPIFQPTIPSIVTVHSW